MAASSSPPRPLPPWLIRAGSVAILVHVVALAVLVLSARSGMWFTPLGPSPALGPQFANALSQVTTDYYLWPLGMANKDDFFHHRWALSFPSNKVDQQQIRFEITLRDEKGEVIEQLRFPQDNVNPWVRHRQELLARGLGIDMPVQIQELMQPERVGAGRQVARETFWMAPMEMRRLFAQGIPHGYFAIEADTADEEVRDPRTGQKKKEKTVDLAKVKRFIPIVKPNEIAGMIKSGVLSPPLVVRGEGLKAVEDTDPLFQGARFYRIRKRDALTLLSGKGAFGTPYFFEDAEPGSRQLHFYQVAVREDQKGAVRALVTQRPEGPMAYRASPWSELLARSYLRHLCRKHGAASAELARGHREPIRPDLMYLPPPLPPDLFIERISHFGDLKRDLEEAAR